MSKGLKSLVRASVFAGNAIIALAAFSAVPASGSETVLYSFQGGSDGANPYSTLITDKSGNLYGTTYVGGNTGCGDGLSCGTIFKIASDGAKSELYAFKGGKDGANPRAGLVMDKAGNLYGTTVGSGYFRGSDCLNYGCGTVFELKANGKEKILYAFKGGSDGANPLAGLIRDSDGNLYGTTLGDFSGTDCASGCGTVFKLTPGGTETVLHAFQGGNDGNSPVDGLALDSMGNLYGTTHFGGNGINCDYGCGTIFKIAPSGAETILYAFQDGSDGAAPGGDLLMDNAGNLLGTAAGGGGGGGTVFKVAPNGTETTLYNFQGNKDGRGPKGLIADATGSLYGVTEEGGGHGCGNGGCGTVFKLASDGTETVLYRFDGTEGQTPAAGLVMGKNGLLYGTTVGGGANNDGVVFSVTQ